MSVFTTTKKKKKKRKEKGNVLELSRINVINTQKSERVVQPTSGDWHWRERENECFVLLSKTSIR